jgi:hypothetical protein
MAQHSHTAKQALKEFLKNRDPDTRQVAREVIDDFNLNIDVD